METTSAVRPAAPGAGGGDEGWDAFVASCANPSFLQVAAWARVKAVNGWTASRILVPGPDGSPLVGAQVLVRRHRLLPWGLAYAPRGPVARGWDDETLGRFTEAARAAPLGRVAQLRVDPEIEAFGPGDEEGRLVAAFRRLGWRPAPAIQPPTTRVVDLGAGEAALWSGLRKKWRQYVNRARAGGVTVVEAAGPDPIPDFYRICRETATRAGFLLRAEQAYRDVWEAYRGAGAASVLFALDPDGVPQATLLLLRTGRTVVEPYGGMTAAGAELRANYLLKWEAMLRAEREGAARYDMWGLAQPGIAHFKAGFGGRELRYVGAWDLVRSGLGRTVFETGRRARVLVARRRAGLAGAGTATAAGAGGTAGDGGADDDGAPADREPGGG